MMCGQCGSKKVFKHINHNLKVCDVPAVRMERVKIDVE